jgi:hypothetical protein
MTEQLNIAIYSTAIKKEKCLSSLILSSNRCVIFYVCAESWVTKATLSIARKTLVPKGLDFLISSYFLLRRTVQTNYCCHLSLVKADAL